MPCVYILLSRTKTLYSHIVSLAEGGGATPTLRSPWAPAARACTASRANMRACPCPRRWCARTSRAAIWRRPPADALRALPPGGDGRPARAHLRARGGDAARGHALPLLAARQRALRAGHRPRAQLPLFLLAVRRLGARRVRRAGAAEAASLVRPRILSACRASISPTPAPSAARRAWRTSLKRGRPAMAFREGRELTERGKKLIAAAAIAVFILPHLRRGLVRGPAAARGSSPSRSASAPGWTRAGVHEPGCISWASRYLQVFVAIIPGEPVELGAGYAFGARGGHAAVPRRLGRGQPAHLSASCRRFGVQARWRCSSPRRRYTPCASCTERPAGATRWCSC